MVRRIRAARLRNDPYIYLTDDSLQLTATEQPTVTDQSTDAADMTSASNPRQQFWGQLVALTGLLLIVAATLQPHEPGLTLADGPWCLVCGESGTLDVMQNVVLFMPFGFGLSRAGLRPALAAVVACAISASIEIAQFHLILGRYGTASDVLTNTAGTALGGWLATRGWDWARPPAVVRRVAGALAVGGVALVTLISALGFRPRGAATPLELAARQVVIMELPLREPRGDASRQSSAFPRVAINGRVILPGAVPAGAVHDGLLAHRSAITASDVPQSSTDRFEPIARLFGPHGHAFALGQVGTTFTCQRRVFASSLGLRTPIFALPNALPGYPATAARASDAPDVECERVGPIVHLRSTSLSDSASGTVALTIGAGWSLFLPGALEARPEDGASWRWMNLTWLFAGAFAFAMGVRCFGSTVPPGTLLERTWPVTAAVMLATVGTHVSMPALAGVASSSWPEMLASLLGAGLGLMVGGRTSWRHESPPALAEGALNWRDSSGANTSPRT